ncbi:hypothetical protein METBIDRAFT_41025 [Metschnikowia bicuspidata var. bicuspidata NRRL YB-4993]|uniref:Uncharacterized protein n=1 Tax=Metschnikowia bicuspidata var. bicuspidata NRRL YB-4993 TaxID=869754 RepID=A0A1A0HCM0_9ASCO|nr:hypothetical protein METBIDRAFT_41025 [Metschnikowia bicuspidata var. bicuspidata NRRL YB-4993]OBA21637.1 hypothetical protein METBIDRAFT_41025 [Metschnikowia bicuspidata var. bicuspidata NRRL YB-4993]
MSFVIYDLEDDVRKLLNIDNFLDGLTPNDFVEELSKDHILKGAEVNSLEYLDPKPYIRTFESTLRHLKNLAEHAQELRELAAKQVEEYELSHSKSVLKLASEVEQIVAQFGGLDTEISSITEKIDPLNQALNKITNSRDRSIETIFLIRSYHGFYTKEKYEPLEKLRTAKDTELKMKCAKTVNNLLVLAKKIDHLTGNLPKVSKCVTTIEKYGETMEQALVERFEIASEHNDFDEMCEIAKVLFDFNGGSSVVLAFMNKSDLFLEDSHDDEGEGVFSILEDEALLENFADPNQEVHDIFANEATDHLLNKLKVSVKGQARIVQQVFEVPIPVLKVMVQRVYAQMIQNRVSTLLLFSQQAGPLAHVRILHALYVLVGDFTKDMKDFFVTNDFDDNNEIGSTLDQCYSDLFIEYITDDSFFKLEKEMLEDIIFGIAQEYLAANEKALQKKELETRLQEFDNEAAALNMTAVGTQQPHNERGRFPFVDKHRLNKFKDFVKMRWPEGLTSSKDVSEPHMKSRGLVKITDVRIVLRMTIDSVARILELAPAKSPELLLEVLEMLILDFGGLYISGGLEVAYDRARQELASASLPQDPLFDYLKVFNLTSEVLFLLSSCIKKIILPCTVNSPPVRSRMISLTNSFVQRCETSLNLILECLVEFVTVKLNQFLQKQKKKDFFCDSIDAVKDYTEVCEELSDFIVHLHALMKKDLNGSNLNNVLIKIGMILLNLLLDHFKKFGVNSTGGIVLTQDVIRYQSVIESWNIPELSERFQILREISNLFTVQPNLINSLITEGHLASLKVSTVRQYISKRTDFSPSYMEIIFGRK